MAMGKKGHTAHTPAGGAFFEDTPLLVLLKDGPENLLFFWWGGGPKKRNTPVLLPVSPSALHAAVLEWFTTRASPDLSHAVACI